MSVFESPAFASDIYVWDRVSCLVFKLAVAMLAGLIIGPGEIFKHVKDIRAISNLKKDIKNW